MTIQKINQVVISQDILDDIARKATKTELQTVKTEIDNQIAAVVSNLVAKTAVETFDDIATTYPNPKEGWTVTVDDTNITYAYDEDTNTWYKISANSIPKATEQLDGLITKELVTKLNTIEEHAQKNKTPDEIFEDIKAIDGVGSGLDADTLQSYTPDDFANADHNHDGRYFTQAQITSALGGKVDKISGKGLSTEDYTTEEKAWVMQQIDGVSTDVPADSLSPESDIAEWPAGTSIMGLTQTRDNWLYSINMDTETDGIIPVMIKTSKTLGPNGTLISAMQEAYCSDGNMDINRKGPIVFQRIQVGAAGPMWSYWTQAGFAIEIPPNSNLNDYTTEGQYYVPLTATAETIANVPSAEAFNLEVKKHGAGGVSKGVIQVFTTYYPTNLRIYERSLYNGTWGDWKEIVTQDQTTNWQKYSLTDINGRAFNITGQDLNNITTGGYYNGSDLKNAPDNTSWWYIEVIAHTNNNGYTLQKAYMLNGGVRVMKMRTQEAGTWSEWTQVGAGGVTSPIVVSATVPLNPSTGLIWFDIS
ncbi:pyocin knob domain-containing protein [Paenibacillus medicaginis]|uniref:Pyocin knob domain-containing protein n=1 Tax=Paenibacillus medicaginis TaxID=1470560 RepID=A0ABV5BV14_9BACL